ncbi:signal recognition particle-docking protein FtsY [uncultured Limosilactobacillus sp.]|uniref:signal recognition particle-docking protein FtsY n=1 Tax=uncultured Limosilactobacillus sp. TaxID=2837629 RepID=UPI0025EAC3D6|nr:signal recognition particle-docking protein FtsY [uncultured Limosilactobacillus sp.]
MGLFDIFRRKKKEKQQATAKTVVEKEQATGSQTTDGSQETGSTSAQAPTSTSESQSILVAASEQSSVASQSVAASVSESQQTGDNEQRTDNLSQPMVTRTSVQSTATVAQSVAPSSTTNVADDGETPEGQDKAPAEVNAGDDNESTTETAKYDRGLKKSRTGFGARLNRFLANFRHVDEDFFEDLEDLLIESDVGVDMAMKLSDELRDEVKLQNAHSKQDVSNVIIEKMVELYEAAGAGENNAINWAANGPTVMMFVGVNGAGKTTTIGKMAARAKKEGKKVLLAAADTFRAGATEQLEVWAERDGVEIVTGPENCDPAAVVFDAVKKAKEEQFDVLFVDTAGRLQNKVNLMKELAKMKRILTREIPDAPHEVLLVLDATTGQNALTQAKLFKESTDVTGIVLTKLDGTARGGIVLAIRNELHLPVKFVGLGEHVDDLQTFDPSEFVYGLFKGLVEE